jgi:hypothetical protein
MATALDLIKRAHRLIGVYSIGEAPSADECSTSLEALNAMLDSWANESLMIYAATLDSITLTPGQGLYTVGPTGSTVTVRPISVDESSYIEWNGISYPLDVVTLQEYNAICLKSLQTTMPYVLWYQPAMPDGQVTLYPAPSASMTLKLWSWKALGSVGLTDTFTLPPGYKKAIAYNLAAEIAPEYEVGISPAVAKGAVMSKKLLKRTNLQVPTLGFDSSVIGGSARFNIYTGLPQ